MTIAAWNFRYIDCDCNFTYASRSVSSRTNGSFRRQFAQRDPDRETETERKRERGGERGSNGNSRARLLFFRVSPMDAVLERRRRNLQKRARTKNSSQWRTVLSSLHAYFNVYRMLAKRLYRVNRKLVWSFKNDI